VSKERFVTDIYETAKVLVGLPVTPDSDAIRMFRLVLAEGRDLIAQRNEIEDRAVALLKDNPDYQLLTSFPGIGPINALTILAEAGDLRRLGHHRQFLKFCGMDLAIIQSGMFRGQTKLSRYGNARLRRTMWMAGQVAILQRANSFRDKFERYILKDRHNTHLDYTLSEDSGDIIRISRRAKPGDAGPQLSPEALDAVHIMAPGKDVYALAAEWHGFWPADAALS
jgi:hypothetical protein